MLKSRLWSALCPASLTMILMVPAPLSAQVCGPDVDGRLAAVDYRETVIVWEPVVEYDQMVLTIGGPCEDIVKVFNRGESVFFDLREIERIGDGAYTWELRRVAPIDAATKKALTAARATDDDRIWWNLWQKGAIPQGPYVDSESFTVAGGVIVPPGQIEGKSQPFAAKPQRTNEPSFASAASPASLGGNQFGFKDQVIPDDLVVQGSTCVGFDCVNNVSFSDSTILMMENNTRIKFDDTSTVAGFPNNDWEIQANSSDSGGGSFLAINDCASSSQGGCADDPLFKVESGARANALYVESDGDVGVGTANPVLDLHIVTGNTPAVRLDQDGSGGFTAQIWDVAGNEANFFIRDVTGGSKLPFRIRPGAPSSSIDIASDGDVGIGTASPAARLHVASGESRFDSVSATLNSHLNFSANGQNYFRGTTIIADDAVGSNVGIGCEGPTSKLVIGGTAASCATAPFSSINPGASTFTTSSSRTLKENLAPVRVPNILDRIDSVEVYRYDFINGPKDRIGLMAEDFHQIFGRGSDRQLSGDEVQMALWLAVKELTARNEELSKRLAELEEAKK